MLIFTFGITNYGIEMSDKISEKVLYTLPVTNKWLEQFILVLHMVGQSSYRRIRLASQWLLDNRLSLDNIHHTITKNDGSIAKIHAAESLSNIDCGANDELFQNNVPILTGAHPYSLYCYLLRREPHRDGVTWGVNLLDLKNKGYDPSFAVADNDQGLRKGHELVSPTLPLRGDHYHILKTLGNLTRHLSNKCRSIETAVVMAMEAGEPSKELSQSLANFESITKTMKTLIGWLRMDVLRIEGPDYQERSMLYDFIVEEIGAIEHHYPEKISKIRCTLIKQKPVLLNFVEGMSEAITLVANQYKVSPKICWQVCELLRYQPGRQKQVEKETYLRQQLRGKYYHVYQAIAQIVKTTIRTSSCVENYNSRIRPYFVLRKSVDQPFLNRLRFYLNHSLFLDSSIPERRGKTPSELLQNKKHPCWLEMLGYSMFKRTA